MFKLNRDNLLKILNRKPTNGKGAVPHKPKMTITSPIVTQVENMFNTPIFPNEIFEKLPDPLKKMLEHFEGRDRDIVLMSSIAVISGVLPNYFGKYDNQHAGTNLFVFIIAMPSAGKSVASWSKKIGYSIHQRKIEKSETAQKIFQNKKDSEKSEESEKAKEPNYEFLFLPGNTSSAALIKAMSENQHSLIMFETESDTVSQMFGKEWGDFSNIFRKSFHHEAISSLRRSEGKNPCEIKRSNLSVLLTGTPNQITKMILSVDDGLFSRFLFYIFDIELTWKDVHKSNGRNSIDAAFDKLGDTFFDVYEKLKGATNNPVLFTLNDEQKIVFNAKFSNWQSQYFKLFGSDTIASVRRLGLCAFRINMILSLLRLIGQDELPQTIVSSDVDFYNSLNIAEVLLQHTAAAFEYIQQLSAQKRKFPKSLSSVQSIQLYEALPREFKREDVVIMSKEIASESTLDRLLKKEKLFERLDFGYYRKKE